MFDEDYETKLKAANMNEEGFANIKKIGDFLNIEFNGRNSDYKTAIAEAMKKKFL